MRRATPWASRAWVTAACSCGRKRIRAKVGDYGDHLTKSRSSPQKRRSRGLYCCLHKPRHTMRTALPILLIAGLITNAHAQWAPVGGGFDYYVHTSAVYYGELYAGGNIASAN